MRVVNTGESLEFLILNTDGSGDTRIGDIETVLAGLKRGKALLKVQVRFVSANDEVLGHGIADVTDSTDNKEMLACAVDRARRNRSCRQMRGRGSDGFRT